MLLNALLSWIDVKVSSSQDVTETHGTLLPERCLPGYKVGGRRRRITAGANRRMEVIEKEKKRRRKRRNRRRKIQNNRNNEPKLTKDAMKSIAKFLFPKIAPLG